jgi:hypothetical protein
MLLAVTLHNMTAPPISLDLARARARAREITDATLRETVERALAAAVEGDWLELVEIVSGAQHASLPPAEAPWRNMASEFFGPVPEGGFSAEEMDLPREEELTRPEEHLAPEELEFPEEVLRPIEKEPAAAHDLGLEVAVAFSASEESSST